MSPNCTRCRDIHSMLSFEIGIAILQYLSEWQRDKVDWSVKNANFFILIGCRNQKRGPDRENSRKYHSFGEKIVKIGPVDPEISCLN